MRNFLALVLGTLFGIILVKAEVLSWFRIQEMFAFQSIHMFGIIGLAVVVGALSVFIIRKMGIKSIEGNVIELKDKAPQYKSAYIGGTIFGLGWAMTGACPGPPLCLDREWDHHHDTHGRHGHFGRTRLRSVAEQIATLK